MEQAQVALKLMLDGLALPSTIKSVSDRKAVQKAVYLGQAAGVNLGYRYNWYRMGPYSPGLTRDYFALASSVEVGDEEQLSAYELRGQVRSKLEKLQPLLAVPDDVALTQANWLELLASVHFLVKRRRMSLEDAKVLLDNEKPHVVSYFEVAVATLENGDLLAA